MKINLRHTLQLAQQALMEADIDYALIGGLALANLGIHRATMDVDLLVDGEKRQLANARGICCGRRGELSVCN